MLTFLRKKMKIIMVVVAVIFIASMFYGLSLGNWGGGENNSKDLAKVDGQAVSPYRYREILNKLMTQFKAASVHELPFIQNMALKQTIDFTLILREAKRKVRVSGQEVKMSIEGILKQTKLNSKEELNRALKRVGLDLSKLRDLIKNELLVRKMVTKIRSEAQVTPQDLREVKASHILVSQEAQAKDIMAKLKQGQSFAALAKKYSLDPGSKSNGGDLGYFSVGKMVEPFEKAAFNTKVGQLSPITKTPFGYHIIKVTDSRLRQFPKKNKDQSVEQVALQSKQEQVFNSWFAKLKNKAKIEIINPEMKAHQLRFAGKLPQAVEAYKKAIGLNPRNPYLRVFLGDLYANLGQAELALSEYKSALGLQPGNPDLYFILAEAYEKAKEPKEALAQYKEASLVAGDNKTVHQRLRDKFKELKAWPEYRAELKKIKEIEKKEKFEQELSGEK